MLIVLIIFPMNNPTNILYTDDIVTIIADLFPKSIHHYLVLPKDNIQDVRSLKQHHIPTLIYMELKGLEFVMRVTGMTPHKFQVGYHAYPSMNRLHLHVLSKDFQGPHMKAPYQWNSFHTEFFIPTYKIISELQLTGRLTLPPKKCLHQNLRCNMCNYSCSDLQNLRLHSVIYHNKQTRC
ncbi:aprataxin isoform X2 [Adelges cooleyi]|uniref:aprataxin isoform X2 n=1 Tax=Adelges cooleyi TaxID=133065 RepID=UPI0021801102|nr:aprataxin isoform X2 [Adelges cooleyi]